MVMHASDDVRSPRQGACNDCCSDPSAEFTTVHPNVLRNSCPGIMVRGRQYRGLRARRHFPWRSSGAAVLLSFNQVASGRMSLKAGVREQHVRKDEAVALHDLAANDGNGVGKHRPRIRKGMEFPVLAAWIYCSGQIGKQAGIEFATREGAVERLRIDAGYARSQPAVDHLACERSRVHTEQREERC